MKLWEGNDKEGKGGEVREGSPDDILVVHL